MFKKSQLIHASDGIPFGGGADQEKPTPTPIEQSKLPTRNEGLTQSREPQQETQENQVRHGLNASTPSQVIPPGSPLTSIPPGVITQKEIFLAIVQGMAANGDFTVGSKLNSDDSIRNAARQAAGVASFFYQAAKAAKL